ncbi:MAG: Zn-dependent hydrolase, glyoxylase, partial [Clostridiales bacterium]|nr:Zn-dependent hydrolase, glyoxylase [Clostridiales bacterium]
MINDLLKGISKLTTSFDKVSPDILLLQFTIVNACIVGNSSQWVLVDAGLENSYEFILKSADEYLGKDSRPKAIILTHGHFDHIGSVLYLSEVWDVPVYAHELELPYITGKKDYPQGDSTVDEGLVAKMSSAFPNRSINLGRRAVVLPTDGSVPGMPEWKWVHTPGHTEGHVSFFRERDRTIIVGDAFTTTKQESFTSVLTQHEQIKGPPAYLTTDWGEAKESVERIKDLKPELAIPSHGLP